MFLSEVYEVLDVIFKNIGTGTTDDNTNWYSLNSRVTTSLDGTGKALSNSSGANGYYYAVPIGTTPSSSSDSIFNTDFRVEFDLISYSGTAYLRCNNFYRAFSTLNLTGGEHICYEIKNGSQKIYINNSPTASWSASGEISTSDIYFTLSDGASMKFKNFVIYPL